MHRRINRRASQIGPRLEGENPTSVSWPPDSEELSYPLSGRHSWMSPSGAAVVADGVQLQRIEITQTVQVVEQSVPPIAGKRSFVRVYFDWKATAIARNVDGTIELQRADGSVLTLDSLQTPPFRP